jgi:predicted fused transcriptional regulator/phosphomethylpyrimidine kinase
MFDPFKMWDEMLDIYQETVMGRKDEREIETCWVTKEIPIELEDEFDALVDNWLAKKGYDPSIFVVGEDE